MNHIIFGSALPFLIGLVYFACRPTGLRFLIVWPLCMVLGALYALIPDIPRFMGLHELYMSMSMNPACDIFLWHYSIDITESDNPIYMVLFLTQCFSIQLCGLVTLKRTAG